VAVTVYRRGAEAVREQATAAPGQAVPSLAAEDLGAYHVTGAGNDEQLALLPL
jgi:hypothetical protein